MAMMLLMFSVNVQHTCNI